MKLKQALTINRALEIATESGDLDSKVKYCIARNLIKLKKIIELFNEENKARLNTFALKDDKGEFVLQAGQPVFGDHTQSASNALEDILNSDVDFVPYTIQRSESTDNILPVVQVELLDIIIIENN